MTDMEMITLTPPVRPWRGLRGTDPAGTGNYGASRDGGKRVHDGLDFLAIPGDECVASIGGVVIRIGWAYPDADLGSIHIEGRGGFAGVTVKALYARAIPDLRMGSIVAAGDLLGIAQDVAAHWARKGVAGMKNHIHLTVTMRVDPAIYLPHGLPS